MKRRFPDGPHINLPLAVIGQMLPALFPFDSLAFGLDVARQYGDIAYYRVGPLRVYQLNHPDLARQILIEQPEKFRKPRLIKHAFQPFAGEGLLTSDGALWKRQRKLMQPAFHQGQLAAYGDVMVSHAARMLESWRDRESCEIHSEMTKLTLGVVVKTLFGADIPREAKDISRSMLAVLDAANTRLNAIVQLPSWIPTRRNLRERRAVARLDATLHALIKHRRELGCVRDDLLSVLLAAFDEESGDRMSDQQLRDEMMTLFLAGHETTANALTWTWYLLSRHPEVEARLQEELHRVLPGRAPAASDLPKLPYTDMIVREVLRLYPPAPGVAREPAEDVSIGGYEVAAGSLVTINIYALHRDPRFFHDPERFDPDRFRPGWDERTARCAYLPFGSGPRVCIGNGFAMMEARLVLATVAQRCRLTLERPEEIQPIQLVTLRPKTGVRMRLERREAALVH